MEGKLRQSMLPGKGAGIKCGRKRQLERTWKGKLVEKVLELYPMGKKVFQME